MKKEHLGQLVWSNGHEYLIEEPFYAHLPFTLKEDVNYKDIIILKKNGFLTVNPGFAWDGASGVTWDTPSSRRGVVIHDALYKLMRKGLLSLEYRIIADKILREVCQLDGMFGWRAKGWYKAVRKFGVNAATKLRKIHRYPKKEEVYRG